MVAFALIGLAMAVLIVANVVSGAVAAGYYRIGVLKSIGLTPAQVVVAYLSRVGVPALAGCVLGVVAGNVLAIPVLHQSADAYGVGSQQVPWWASVLAPAGMLALTVLAAFGPALRAGRLSATQAIAAGRAPATGRGYAAYRLADPAAPAAAGRHGPGRAVRPARAHRGEPGRDRVRGHRGDLRVRAECLAGPRRGASRPCPPRSRWRSRRTVPAPRRGPSQCPDAAQDAAVTAALRAQPGTAHQTHGVPEQGQGAGRARERERVGVRRRVVAGWGTASSPGTGPTRPARWTSTPRS